MNLDETFKIILLIGRPAAGKSEIIDYLKRTPTDERIRRFHIGDFAEIDDFPMLWAWFEEDDILTEMGRPRLHSDEEGYFLGHHLWNVLIRRISLDYNNKFAKKKDYAKNRTAILEFSRGKEHGGYREAFTHLSKEILPDLAVMYIDVPWEESLRKNRARANPDDPGSILQHSLSDEKLAYLYKEVDWPEVSAPDPEFLFIQGFRVPYAMFANADDVTTARGEALGERLEGTLDRLWKISRRAAN